VPQNWVTKTGVFLMGAAVPACAGCFRISIAPACPRELEVGDTGAVWANEIDPGAIPTYQWEVIPADAGAFADATKAATEFTAEKAGDAVIRLSAADGFFQVASECITKVVATGTVAVSMTVDPSPITVGETATLTCSSTGEVAATTLALSQTAGPDVTLASLSPGVATFTPEATGTLTFTCTGRSSGGRVSKPFAVTVTVEEVGRGGGRR